MPCRPRGSRLSSREMGTLQHFPPTRLLAGVMAVLAFLGGAGVSEAQVLTINNDVQTYATLASTTATLTGKAELHITGTGDPIIGCTIQLNSTDAWFFMEKITPAAVVYTFL